MTDRIVKDSREIIREMTVMTEAGTDLEKDHFPGAIAAIGTEVQAQVGPGQGLRASKNRHRKRCYKCREYDHFVKDCPTSREEKEIEQLQQMLNLGDEQTSLKSLIINTQDNCRRANSEENLRQGHLNLQQVRMTPPHFYLSAPR